MAAMNALKVLAVLALMAGLHPLLAFALLGIGAAAYAPAKYGLVTELAGEHQLVAANGWLEVTVVAAVLLGAALGGALVSPALLQGLAPRLLDGLGLAGTAPLQVSAALVLALHGVAAWLNVGLPDSGARYARCAWHPGALTRELAGAQRALWRDADGGLSLAVTTLFWGVSAVMQFAVIRWAGEELGLSLSQAAMLQAAVALGVVGGAALAGRRVALAAARRVLPVGVVLGLLLPLAAPLHSVWLALPLMLAVGVAGGYLVVPMNALLQHRGAALLTAGRSIAVQNFNENGCVLLMMAAYAAAGAAGAPIVPLMGGLGLAVAGFMALAVRHSRRMDAAGPVDVAAQRA